jgi:hypothetical protein
MVGTLDNKSVVVVGVLKGVCVPADLLDLETYSGEDAKYNKWQFAIEKYWILPEPVSFDDIRSVCRVPAEDKTPNNLFKCVHFRAEIFYAKKGVPSEILDRYLSLVSSWMSSEPTVYKYEAQVTTQ